jgi:YHS domain-containing protein
MSSIEFLEERWAVGPARKDPVCGEVLGDKTPAFVRRDGVDYHFCSERCLRIFMESPDSYSTSAA